MRRSKNSYSNLKNRRNLNKLLRQEEPYWIGAGALSMMLVGIIDGGVSVTIAYLAKKAYDKFN